MASVVEAAISSAASGFSIMFIIFYLQRGWVLEHGDLTAGIITSVILILALIPALNTLSAMHRDRMVSITMRIREAYDSGELIEARKLTLLIINEQEKQGIDSTEKQAEDFRDIVKDYRKNKPSEFLRLIMIPSLFDLIGCLVREHCCEAKAIDAQLNWESAYELWEPYIRDIQKKQKGKSLDDSPTAMYGNFIWLVNNLMK